MLSKETILLLEDIERRIDVETEEDYIAQWKKFLDKKFEGDIFIPERKKLSKPELEVKHININDALNSYDLMLRRELEGVSHSLNSEVANLAIRANYGTGIMTSMFGAEIFTMPREADTLPTTRSVNDTGWIKAKLEKGLPEVNSGFALNVFEFGEFCKEVFSKYPKIEKYVKVYHPDLQGPLDICELLWGGEMFYSMFDEPEVVHGMLNLVTDTYTMVMEKWFGLYKPEEINPHWGSLWHKGTILLRNDSAMNISKDMFEEFSKPYDNRLLNHFGGGCMHFCGRGDHYSEVFSEMPMLNSINMSQPQYNDMEKIYKNTVDKGIMILAFSKEWAEKDKVREGGFNHLLSSF